MKKKWSDDVGGRAFLDLYQMNVKSTRGGSEEVTFFTGWEAFLVITQMLSDE